MKKRQGMAEHIRFADLPDMNDISGIMDKIFLGENSTFWFSGAAGGIDNKPRFMRFNFNP